MQQAVDVHSVDLNSSEFFQTWVIGLHAQGIPPLVIADSLCTLETPVAYARALQVAYWNSIDTAKYHEFCLTTSDVFAELTSMGFYIYKRSVRLLADGGSEVKSRLSEMEGVLLSGIKRIEKVPQNDLTREAHIGLLVPLAAIQMTTDRAEEAVQSASSALYLAERINGPMSIARTRTTLIGMQATSGQAKIALDLIADDRKSHFRYDSGYTDMQLGAILVQLGNYETGISHLQAVTESHLARYVLRAQSQIQRIQTIWGRGGIDGPIVETAPGSYPWQWLVASMRHLISATGIPREGKDFDQRLHKFREAIVEIRDTEANNPLQSLWEVVFSKWILATAHIGRGEFSEAAGAIDHSSKIYTEWLDLRVLNAGVALELALTLNAPSEYSVSKYEHELRKIFADAEANRYASPAGLAALLERWHPTAAAYLALMPDPILACSAAAKRVLKLGQYNYLDETTIPPVMACDLMLRSLDFDLRRRINFIQGDAGSSRKKRKVLMARHYDTDYYYSPVSSIKIIRGLMGTSKPKYHDRAATIAKSYGIAPATNATYPMIGYVEELAELTNDLLAQNLTPAGFDKKVSQF